MKTQILSKAIGLEHPSVKSVIEIAEDIMSKNKTLDVETLYYIAKKKLRLPRNGLLFIIQFLITKKILIEGSKFSRKTVLLNFTRRRIYNYIKLNPGIHFSVLRKEALPNESGSSGQLVWHLEMLLKFNYIKKIKVGNYTIFIPFNMKEDKGMIIFLLRDRINKKIMHLLVENKTLIKPEIFKEIGEKREDVYYRIKNLLDHELITTSGTSDKKININSDLKELVIDILNLLEIKNKKNYFSRMEDI
jgi:predicted transcriptional regulator